MYLHDAIINSWVDSIKIIFTYMVIQQKPPLKCTVLILFTRAGVYRIHNKIVIKS